jgi:hypothetical protein
MSNQLTSGYVLFEIPCNIALKLTSPKLWLPTLTLAWGIVATLMGVTQNLAGFFVVRFFLGATESGLFPGVVYCKYLTSRHKPYIAHVDFRSRKLRASEMPLQRSLASKFVCAKSDRFLSLPPRSCP